MYFADALELGTPRRTADGYLAVRARAAKTGVYQYTGREVDPDNKHGHRDTAVINVLRDADTVFDKAAVSTFIGKPITDDHPSVAVNAANWRDHGRGVIMGALRDGDHLAFDLLIMDGPTIDKVEAGKRQLSNGYRASLEFGDFIAPDGTKCQARQSRISDGNHVAVVDRARGGETCRIGDVATCDALSSNILDNLTTEKPVKTMLIDGLTVDVSNPQTAADTIQTLIAARDTARTELATLQTENATLKTDAATKGAKITTLEQQVKDAAPTPAQLRAAGKSLMDAAAKAKSLGVTVGDEMDEAQIMAATVTAKMGDAAKDWTVDQVAASFAVLTKDAKPVEMGVQPLGTPVNVGDAETGLLDAQRKAAEYRRNAWKTPATTSAAA